MLATIFTATHNRGYIINELYKSLLQQTNFDFEWLVVDDGSTDNTKEIIEELMNQKKINIRYIWQENKGKHIAINNGARNAYGELFFIVDSDDYLKPNAIELIEKYYNQIKNDKHFCGICGLKVNKRNQKVGGEYNYKILDCSYIDFRNKYKIRGDVAEIVKTSIMRDFPFPEFEGEKFCPETLIWSRMAKKYIFRYFYERIYVCEYLSDGLSSSSFADIRKNNPQNLMLTYKEQSGLNLSIIRNIKNKINYWRTFFYSKQKLKYSAKQIGCIALFWLPAGFLLYIYDELNKNRK